MKTLTVAYLGLGLLLHPSLAAAAEQKLGLDAVNRADFSAKSQRGPSPAVIKAQVLLDRARFSPGVIDGQEGDNMRNALRAFEKAHGMTVDGALDDTAWTKLNEGSSDPVLTEYTISPDDVKGSFVKKIPNDIEEQAKLDHLGYSGPEELLAEKFHMDEDLLEALNPGKSFDEAGTSIVVANVLARPQAEKKATKVARIEVVKSEHILRALAQDGSLIAVYPASIGSEEKPTPDGTYTVRAIAENPTYTYDPNYGFKGIKAKEKVVVQPGPNNPVGSVWIDLSIPSFGIHGTPEPAKVGKAYSHGCARLTNWDAEDLAKMVHKGTTVAFVN